MTDYLQRALAGPTPLEQHIILLKLSELTGDAPDFSTKRRVGSPITWVTGLLFGLLLLSGLGGAALITGLGAGINIWLSIIFGGNALLVNDPFIELLDPSECLR